MIRVLMTGFIEFNYILTTDERLKNVTQEFETPTVVYSTIDSEGYGTFTTLPLPSKSD